MSEYIKEIELKKIQPNRLNPRTEFRKETLDELADSISEVGLLQPLIVRPADKGFEVVVGERRYRASHQAGLEKVPAIIRSYSDDQVIELNLIENIHREDLSAVEKGRTCLRLMEMFPEKYPNEEAVGKHVGLSALTIRDWLKLVTAMPRKVQRMVAPETASRRVPEGKIEYTTAVRIARKIKEPHKQLKVAETLLRRGIRGAKARSIVTEVAKRPEKPIEEIVKEVIEKPASIPFRLNAVEPILNQAKTQICLRGLDSRIRRDSIVHADLYEPKFAELKVKEVLRKRLGDFTEEDVKREGGLTMEQFKRQWEEMYGEGSWDNDERVDIVRFEVVKLNPKFEELRRRISTKFLLKS
ncbi:ParB/RepB/Spo0J family partition protein [Candidatus Bathyarchaeota archaeon]|nr:ParB/RepB/Spo0J family partition protein [Candidatus Bathyarchaeota archaeon]